MSGNLSCDFAASQSVEKEHKEHLSSMLQCIYITKTCIMEAGKYILSLVAFLSGRRGCAVDKQGLLRH